MHTPLVMLFLKAPRPGFVKTRLARELGPEKALAIYRELVEAQVRRIPAEWRTEVHVAPADAEAEVQAWLGPASAYVPQADGDLGARLSAAFARAFAQGARTVIAIGGDCPDLDAACLDTARRALRENDVVLGPALDGGYYLIGMRRASPEVFQEVPWSSARVLAVTQARAAAAGLSCTLLEPKEDIDDAASWRRFCARSKAPGRPASASPVTLIIPTLNEAAGIGACITAARERMPDTRIIVVDAGSSDGTAAIAANQGADVVTSMRGRGVQCAAGAKLARSEWLLFLHADTRLPVNAGAIVAAFTRRPDARIATFRLRFDEPGFFLRACCWFTRFDSVFTRFGDQGILILRSFHDALGGFPAWPLFEDVALLQRARARTRVHSLPACVTTSARRFQQRGHFAQQVLNARLLLRYLGGASPHALAELYRAPTRPPDMRDARKREQPALNIGG